MRNAYKIFFGKLEIRDHLQDLGVDASTLLQWILKRNRVYGCGLDSTGSGLGSICKYVNEHSVPLQWDEFLGQLSNYKMFNGDPELFS
jgi:hypothetical protein